LDPLQTTVADGDAEDVATQVLEHFAATAGGLTVYDPVFLPDLR
jgi:adenosylmethionine-8-amino-7-oxononanoate aminotransferase